MRSARRGAVALAGGVSLMVAGCASDAIDASAASVVYGTDSRQELYELADGPIRTSALSTVALMRPTSIDLSNPAAVRWNADTVGESQLLCPGELFADQPSPAFCSGTLIDDDLVLTAGHCVENRGDCLGTRLVLDFHLSAAGTLETVTSDDVYSCRSIVVRERSTSGAFRDYAILQLDRPVTSRAPVAVGADVLPGNQVILPGYPSGMPLKVDVEGDVQAVDDGVFTATIDAFGGNSGSGVLNASGEVVGILSAGARDYVQNGRCFSVNVATSGGETVGTAQPAIDALCAAGYPSERLCGATGDRCGDGFCTADETEASCAGDCTPPAESCGDGNCADAELTTCQADCFGMPPAGWRCRTRSYWSGRGCDCDCGAYDPDCDNPRLPVRNCGTGETCSAEGTCTGDEPTEPDAAITSEPDAGSSTVEDAAVSLAADGSSAADGAASSVVTHQGCGCRVTGSSTSRDSMWSALGLALGALVVRRRRAR